MQACQGIFIDTLVLISRPPAFGGGEMPMPIASGIPIPEASVNQKTECWLR